MTNEQLAPLFEGTNFGHTNYREIVLEGLMKVATHYHNGYTLENILKDNGFTKVNSRVRELTETGRRLMWDLYTAQKERT